MTRSFKQFANLWIDTNAIVVVDDNPTGDGLTSTPHCTVYVEHSVAQFLMGDNYVAFIEWFKKEVEKPNASTLTLRQLNLSVRLSNVLEFAGIETVEQLVGKTEDDLLYARSFGVISLNEVKEKLAAHGLKLKNS